MIHSILPPNIILSFTVRIEVARTRYCTIIALLFVVKLDFSAFGVPWRKLRKVNGLYLIFFIVFLVFVYVVGYQVM